MTYKIDDPSAIVKGKSISDWSADWWRWILDGPKDPFSPVADKTGLLAYQHNFGSVFFLAGTDGGEAERYIVIPHNKPILVPMLNAFDVEGPKIPDAHSHDPKPLIDETIGAFLKSVTEVHLTIDGKDVVGKTNGASYETVTGFFDAGKTTRGSYAESLGVPRGVELYPTKAAGFYAMIENLPRGIHTISFGGSGKNPGNNEPFQTEVKDHILVI
jgi:hypothetical protein